MRKLKLITGFFAGILCGLAGYHAALKLGDFTLVSRHTLEQQRSLLTELQE
jgi:hypothetical protein